MEKVKCPQCGFELTESAFLSEDAVYCPKCQKWCLLEIEKVRTDLRDAIKTNASTMLATIEKLRNENAELKQKLQQLVKEIPSCIDCEYYLGDEEGNGHCSLSEQQHVDSVCCLKDKFLNDLPKKFEELLKEVKT
jgi:formamidopyrimidine-DNA glycosylase